MKEGWAKFAIFSPISRCISVKVPDRAEIAINH